MRGGGFGKGNLKQRYSVGDLCVDLRIVFEGMLGNQNGDTSTGLIWLRIRKIGGLLLAR
jgi:hypothetical protein